MPNIPSAELAVAESIAELVREVEAQPEYSETGKRDNHLADIAAILTALQYAIRSGEVPRLAASARAFLDSSHPHGE